MKSLEDMLKEYPDDPAGDDDQSTLVTMTAMPQLHTRSSIDVYMQKLKQDKDLNKDIDSTEARIQ